MKTLVTGCSRGIGFALVSQALEKGQTVFAVARDVSKLRPLQADYPKVLVVIEADVTKKEDISKIAIEVSRAGGVLDVLINNAGVYKKDETAEAFADSFLVNATTPFLLTKALLPFLKKSKAPKVTQVSTLMGSIADNSSGGSYAYRASKSALNMVTKSLSVDNPDVTFALVHPGWVKTDMGGDAAPVEVTESARGIWKVIESTGLNESGCFKDYRGKTLSW